MAGRFDNLTFGRFLQGALTLCNSEAVHTAQYREEVEQLIIQFHSSPTSYTYFVTKSQAIDFAQSASKGKWIAANFPRLNW